MNVKIYKSINNIVDGGFVYLFFTCYLNSNTSVFLPL